MTCDALITPGRLIKSVCQGETWIHPADGPWGVIPTDTLHEADLPGHSPLDEEGQTWTTAWCTRVVQQVLDKQIPEVTVFHDKIQEGKILLIMKSVFIAVRRTLLILTAKVLSPTLEVMRPSMAPCSVSNSCSLCRRPWWRLLEARTDTTDSRARTSTGPSIKSAKVSTRYRTGSPCGAVRKQDILATEHSHPMWKSPFMPIQSTLNSYIHLMEAETSMNSWWCCCCTCSGSSRKLPGGRMEVWSNANGFCLAPPGSHAQTPPCRCWLWQRRSIAYHGTGWPGGISGYHTDRPAVHLWKRYEFTVHSRHFAVHLGQQANRKTWVSPTFSLMLASYPSGKT